MRTFRLGLIPLLALSAVSPPQPAGAAPASAFPAPTNYLRLFAETNGGGDPQQVYTEAEAVALARRHDVIVGLRWTFDDFVTAMKQANPRLTLLVYMNGAMSKVGDRASMPEAWFLHDAGGRRIDNKYFPLQYMDVGHAGWRGWVADRCAEWLHLSGFDGCWLDDMGSGNLGTNLSAWPIDPRSGAEMIESDWIGYAQGELAVVAAENPTAVLASNGLNNGGRYFPPLDSRRLLDVSDAATADGWLRNSTATATTFPSLERWRQDVDMLVDAGSRGRSVLAQTKLWTDATAAQQEQWRLFAYASLLLATNGHQFLHFNVGGPGKPDAAHAFDSFRIGAPSEDYVLRNGVYQRRYTRGLAIVNPGSTSVRVNFGGTYIMPNGQAASSTTMAPKTGLILRLDWIRPLSTITEPQRAARVASPVTISGIAKDRWGVAAVRVAIRSRATGQWLQSNGTWASTYAYRTATLASPGGTSTTWSLNLGLPTGRYGVSVRAVDTSRNVQEPNAWSSFEVI